MSNEAKIYAVDAQLLNGNEQERVVILVYAGDIWGYAEDAELVQNRIRIYQQRHQIRRIIPSFPFPSKPTSNVMATKRSPNR